MDQDFEKGDEMPRSEGSANGKVLKKAEGLAEGQTDKAEGQTEKSKGQTEKERLDKLIERLLDEGRFLDAIAATRYARTRARLYKKYGI